MLALHHVLGGHGHIVAEVVETELIVRTEGDVALVSVAALLGVGAVLVDTVYGRTVEHIERAHPFGVTLGEVVVDGHDMHAAFRQGAEEHREGGHQGLTFTGRHLGDFAGVENDTTDELHIVVDHIPGDFVSAGHPFVFPDSLVPFDGDELASLDGEFAVKVGGGHLDGLVGGETGCGLTHCGEHDGEMLVELVLKGVEDFLLVLVDFIPEGLTLVEGELLDFLFQ